MEDLDTGLLQGRCIRLAADTIVRDERHGEAEITQQ